MPPGAAYLLYYIEIICGNGPRGLSADNNLDSGAAYLHEVNAGGYCGADGRVGNGREDCAAIYSMDADGLTKRVGYVDGAILYSDINGGGTDLTETRLTYIYGSRGDRLALVVNSGHEV